MFEHYRLLMPVGHGGFCLECIDNTVVAFDCGSKTFDASCFLMVANIMKCHHIREIDYLVISHFDIDHVNCIKELSSIIHVKRILTPAIPSDLRLFFDALTKNALSELDKLGENRGEMTTEIVPVEEERKFSDNHQDPVWDWFVKSMWTTGDFNNIRAALSAKNISMEQINNREFVEENYKKINKIFKPIFAKEGGVNAKGLIMLSQKSTNRTIDSVRLLKGCPHHYYDVVAGDLDKTSCLYVGDAVLKTGKEQPVQHFLVNHRADNPLLLMQIPHHGSRSNSDVQFSNYFPSHFYFCHDKDDKRIKKNMVYNTISNKLLMLRVDIDDFRLCVTYLS